MFDVFQVYMKQRPGVLLSVPMAVNVKKRSLHKREEERDVQQNGREAFHGMLMITHPLML